MPRANYAVTLRYPVTSEVDRVLLMVPSPPTCGCNMDDPSCADLVSAYPMQHADDLLCFLIHSTDAAFNRMYRKPLKQLGLTYPQYMIMLTLWAADSLRASEIEDRLRLEREELTPLLQQLEDLSYVRRVPASGGEDWAVTLTPKGQELRGAVGEVLGCAREAVGLDDAALSDLMARVRSLRDNLEAASSLAQGLCRRP